MSDSQRKLIKSATGKLAMSTQPEAAADEERGTTMTLRKAHTTATNRSPTIFPKARVQDYDGASTSEKKKILAQDEKAIKRMKLRKRPQASSAPENFQDSSAGPPLPFPNQPAVGYWT